MLLIECDVHRDIQLLKLCVTDDARRISKHSGEESALVLIHIVKCNDSVAVTADRLDGSLNSHDVEAFSSRATLVHRIESPMVSSHLCACDGLLKASVLVV